MHLNAADVREHGILNAVLSIREPYEAVYSAGGEAALTRTIVGLSHCDASTAIQIDNIATGSVAASNFDVFHCEGQRRPAWPR